MSAFAWNCPTLIKQTIGVQSGRGWQASTRPPNSGKKDVLFGDNETANRINYSISAKLKFICPPRNIAPLKPMKQTITHEQGTRERKKQYD